MYVAPKPLSFRLVPTSVTLNDLERRNSPYYTVGGRLRPAYYVASQPAQLSLAIPSWVSAMSTSRSPKGGDALRLESKGRCGLFVVGR